MKKLITFFVFVVVLCQAAAGQGINLISASFGNTDGIILSYDYDWRGIKKAGTVEKFFQPYHKGFIAISGGSNVYSGSGTYLGTSRSAIGIVLGMPSNEFNAPLHPYLNHYSPGGERINALIPKPLGIIASHH